MSSFNIPPDGLKLICVAGTFDGNAIWRTVGKLTVAKSGKPVILLDRTFNPAGTIPKDGSLSLMINLVEFSPEDLKKKKEYKSRDREPKQRQPPPPSRSSGFDDFEDDIPF